MSRSVYLIAYYSIKPKYKNTNRAGWMDNADNVQWDEQIAVANKLKPRDLQTAKVILDLANRSVYRNSWNSERSFDDLFEHYYDGYKKYLDPVIEQLGYEMVSVKDQGPETTA
jgi:hypothetical protein